MDRPRHAGPSTPGAVITLLVAWVVAAATLVACAPPDAAAAPPPGAAVVDGPVDIGGGRELYLHCAGPTTPGRPTIVLESGYHDSSDPWSLSDAAAPAVGPSTFERLARADRVCAYDRPGTFRYTDPLALTDRSTPVPMPRTARDVTDDLHTLLATAHVPGPYVLVGHSLGGLFVRLYAQLHPRDVAGVVFVDSFPAGMPDLMGGAWPAYRALLAAPVPAFAHDPRAEVVDLDRSVAQVRAAPAFPPVPVAVLSKTEPFPLPPGTPPDIATALERAWPRGQEEFVALTPRTPHVLATGSDHYVQVHDPDLVAAAARLVLTRAGH
jgi:pimeloyl-ACP methyl ester carboxylesterase